MENDPESPNPSWLEKLNLPLADSVPMHSSTSERECQFVYMEAAGWGKEHALFSIYILSKTIGTMDFESMTWLQACWGYLWESKIQTICIWVLQDCICVGFLG